MTGCDGLGLGRMQIARRTRHERAEIMAEFRMTQRECESGFEKSDLAAAIEAPAPVKPFSEHRLLFQATARSHPLAEFRCWPPARGFRGSPGCPV